MKLYLALAASAAMLTACQEPAASSNQQPDQQEAELDSAGNEIGGQRDPQSYNVGNLAGETASDEEKAELAAKRAFIEKKVKEDGMLISDAKKLWDEQQAAKSASEN